MSEDRDFQKRLLNHLSSLLDGMRTLNQHVSGNIEAIGRFEAEFTKISRQNNQLATSVLNVSSEVAQHRMDTTQRLDVLQHGHDALLNRHDALLNRHDALLLRLDEIENAVDGNSRHLKDLSTEVRGQYNDILTAIQHGVQNNVVVRELSDRVEAIERRLGM